MLYGVSPNPQKPPFFLDKPFKVVDGKVQVVLEVWKRYAEVDIIHGHLKQYLKQPVRLRGILFVHGTLDNFSPVSLLRALDKAMTDLGIEHVYEEHGGGHDFIAEKSLKFLSEHLAFEMPPTVSVQPRGKLATTWVEMKRGK